MNKTFFVLLFVFMVYSCLKPNCIPFEETSATKCSDISYTEYNGNCYRIISEPYRINDTGQSYTHKAIRIDIKNMKQLFQLLADSSLYIQFYPFNFKPIKDYSKQIKSNSQILFPKSDGVECMISDYEVDTRIMSPVYVFWPRQKTIPDSLHYEVLYEAFIQRPPIDDETIGNKSNNKGQYPSRDGKLKTFDNRLNQFVSLGNVLISYTTKFQIMLGVWASIPNVASVNSDGEFHLSNPATDQALEIVLLNNKFVICNGSSSDPKYILTNNLEDYIAAGNDSLEINLSTDSFFLDVHKAAQYYFYQENDLLNLVEKYDTLGSLIDIHAIDNPSPDGYLGCFYNISSPYIEIFNRDKTNYTGASSKIFGTVNHELGHATNRARTGQQVMSQTDTVIKESFASFFGWYNVYRYYSSIATTHQIVNSICTQGRQTWTATSSNINYTPIFIDLFDNYNQHTSPSSTYNQDPISGVPINIILNYALGPTSFHNVYYPLASLIGSYYTGSEYSAFISPYSLFL